MGTYLKPKGIQSYLRIWGSYDPIGSNPSETKKGVLYECSVKNQIFGPFLAQKGALAPPLPPPQRPPCKAVNTKRLFFRCPVMIVTIFLRLFTKNWFRAKKLRFWTPKGPLWAIGAMKRPAERPNGHLPKNRTYTELPQDMGKIWSHWVESVWPQKMGVIWV